MGQPSSLQAVKVGEDILGLVPHVDIIAGGSVFTSLIISPQSLHDISSTPAGIQLWVLVLLKEPPAL